MFEEIDKIVAKFFAAADEFIAGRKSPEIPVKTASKRIPVVCYTEVLPGDAIAQNIKPLTIVGDQLYKVEMI